MISRFSCSGPDRRLGKDRNSTAAVLCWFNSALCPQPWEKHVANGEIPQIGTEGAKAGSHLPFTLLLGALLSDRTPFFPGESSLSRLSRLPAQGNLLKWLWKTGSLLSYICQQRYLILSVWNCRETTQMVLGWNNEGIYYLPIHLCAKLQKVII